MNAVVLSKNFMHILCFMKMPLILLQTGVNVTSDVLLLTICLNDLCIMQLIQVHKEQFLTIKIKPVKHAVC